MQFDIALVVDKCLRAQGILSLPKVNQVLGFITDKKSSAILPATPAAQELWEIGLSNEKKFFINKKPETQLVLEALELGPYRREPYDLPLLGGEAELAKQRRKALTRNFSQPVIGFNTGCSNVMLAKRWTPEFHLELIQKLWSKGYENLVLLGGPEDEERNRALAQNSRAQFTPCRAGLRDGLVSIEACDLVVSGDSLGMHMAIARRKQVLAWFGPTCAQEIDLYDRGEKMISPMSCSPCWKRSCDHQSMCYDSFSLDEVFSAIERNLQCLTITPQFSLSKPLSSAI